jgi:hypothetical protein
MLIRIRDIVVYLHNNRHPLPPNNDHQQADQDHWYANCGTNYRDAKDHPQHDQHAAEKASLVERLARGRFC